MKDRAVRILDVLANNKSIKITMLAELMGISQVTLRKDLDALEKRGIILRSHGFTKLNETDSIGKRLAFSYSIKRKIAKEAVQIIEEDETVMIESGSCCALFAEELALSQKNITIVTNSVFIAFYISKLPGIKVILLGGYFQPESQVLVGSMTIKCAETVFFDKFFLGADGFIPDQAFTGRDHLRVDTAIELSKHANKVFVLTEAAKFLRRGAYSLFPLDFIDGVFTDDKIPREAEAALARNCVRLYKVSSVV